MRNWRTGTGRLVLLGLLSAACASTPPQGDLAIPTPWERCRAILDQGVFTEASLRCFSEVAEAVETALCQDHFGRHDEANTVGFGYGTRIFGVELVDPKSDGGHSNLVPFTVEEIDAWRTEHCSGSEPRAAPDWEAIRDRLPLSLVGPWHACRESSGVSEQRFEMGTTQGVGCVLVGSYDLTGESEMVGFEAAYSSSAWLDLTIPLREDLYVEGADCGGEAWQAGSLLRRTRSRVLYCRRQGRSAVTMRLVTAAGTCERHLPPLTEEPWQKQCGGSPVRTAPDYGLLKPATAGAARRSAPGGCRRGRP